MIPPLSKEQKLTPATLPQIKSLPMNGTVGTMLAHLDYLVCRVRVVFILFGGLRPCSILIVCFCSQQLVVIGYYGCFLLAIMVPDDNLW